MRLALHIGLHKTGTSAIQQHLLRGEPGYLGKNSNTRNFAPYIIKEISTLSTEFHFLPAEEIKHRVANWTRQMLVEAGRFTADVTIKISEERISNWPQSKTENVRWPIYYGIHAHLRPPRRTGTLPFISLLREHLLPELNKHGIDLHVILTLRNQPDWLGSFYAQASDRIPLAGQTNFESQVNRLIEESDPILDYADIVKEIQECLGASRLRILFHEELGTVEFHNDLCDAFDGKYLPEPTAIESTNRLREAKDTWSLRKSKRGIRRFYIKENRSITMTEFLRKKILRHVAPKNMILSNILNKNLAALGYYEPLNNSASVNQQDDHLD